MHSQPVWLYQESGMKWLKSVIRPFMRNSLPQHLEGLARTLQTLETRQTITNQSHTQPSILLLELY